MWHIVVIVALALKAGAPLAQAGPPIISKESYATHDLCMAAAGDKAFQEKIKQSAMGLAKKLNADRLFIAAGCTDMSGQPKADDKPKGESF